MKNFKFILLALLCVTLGSCSSGDEKIEYEYLPVKLAGSESWSIMDVKSGEIIYKDEFKNQPSAIYNDIFLVENDKGTFDYYSVSDVKTPINKESFYMASDFVGSDIVAATKPGKTISLINTKCEEIVALDKSIVACSNFKNGLAAFKDANEKLGFLNTKGEIVIKAKYDNVQDFSDGIAMCSVVDSKKKITTYYAVDNSGKELFSFNNKEYNNFGEFSDGFLPVVKGDKVIYIDKEGKKAYDLCNIEDSTSYDVYFCLYKEGRSVFCEGNTYGLKDKDNKIILRAKYDYLANIGNDKYIARQEGKYGLIDHEDKHLIDFKYDDITKMNDDVLLVQSGKTYTLINLKGEDVTTYNFTKYSLSSYTFVKSNYIDPKDYALKIFKSFDENTCRGYNSSMTVADFMDELLLFSTSYDSDDDTFAAYYSDKYTFTAHGKDELNKSCVVAFDGPISSRTYKFRNIYYYSFKVPDGYAFNKNTKIRGVFSTYDISEYDIVENKICDEFEKLLKSKGYKSLDNNFFESSKGNVVGMAYKDGVISLYYYFSKEIYVDIARELRTQKAKKTPEGMPNDELEVAEDSVAVD